MVVELEMLGQRKLYKEPVRTSPGSRRTLGRRRCQGDGSSLEMLAVIRRLAHLGLTEGAQGRKAPDSFVICVKPQLL